MRLVDCLLYFFLIFIAFWLSSDDHDDDDGMMAGVMQCFAVRDSDRWLLFLLIIHPSYFLIIFVAILIIIVQHGLWLLLKSASQVSSYESVLRIEDQGLRTEDLRSMIEGQGPRTEDSLTPTEDTLVGVLVFINSMTMIMMATKRWPQGHIFIPYRPLYLLMLSVAWWVFG